MATSGLRDFASNVRNRVVESVNNTINSYASTFNTIRNNPGALLGLAGNSLLDRLNDSKSKSSAANFRAAGNKRDHTIYDFLANFKTGVMKTSRFRAEFKLPTGVIGSTGVYSVNRNAVAGRMASQESGFNREGSINIKCHMATFPQRSLQTFDFRSNSVPFRIPYATSYDPITLSFYADGNMDTREYFELWQSSVMNFGNNTLNFYNEYVSDVKLFLQNERETDTYGIMLYECYPMNIGMFDVSYAASSSVLNIVVTLAYKSWLPLSNSNASSFNRTFR